MNGEIAFDLNVYDVAPEETHAWADNEPFMSMHSPAYNPEKLISMIVWQDFKRIDISMAQEEFISMVRALNNEKNKLLKTRREHRTIQQIIEGDGINGNG